MNKTTKLLTVALYLVFLTKYCVVGYTVLQLVGGYGFHPPTWYYYPLLLLLVVSLHQVQNSVSGMFMLSFLKAKAEEDGPKA